jgi:outer membrane lipoprotein-sorting protein
MTMRFFVSIVGLILFFSASLFAQDATEIVRRADKKMRGETNISEMTMRIERPDWSREVSLKSWMKGNKLGLILITAPARDKGTTFLKRNTEIWNWIPSVEKVVKIPPSMMMQSWMGSDFTNDDLIKESSIVDDYAHEIVGDTTIDGHECWKIKMLPKPEAPVVWGKLLAWITKDGYLELRVEYYDEDGKMINIMNLSDIREMDGRNIPTTLEMIPVDEPDHKTIIHYETIDFNQPLDNSFFSEQNMKRVH